MSTDKQSADDDTPREDAISDEDGETSQDDGAKDTASALDADFDTDATPADDSVEGEEPAFYATGQAAPEGAQKKQRSFTGLLGVGLSLLALAGVAYVHLTRESLPELDFAAPSDIAAVRQQQESLGAAISALESRLESVAGVGDDSANSRERLAATLRGEIRALEERLARYDSLPPRVGNLENAVAGIQGIEAGARDTLLLAEAEYYLQTANTLATLAGNVELAKVALDMADDRLVSIGNPALNNVRQAISDEVTALEGLPALDVESNAILLASLAQLADSLPLKPVESTAAVAADAEVDEEPGTAGRAWNAIREAMGDIVKVTPPGDDTAPLLIPGTEPLLRSNLALQLQAARLALLTREQMIFEQSLDDADAWLEQYFDASSMQVQNARETIAEIRVVELRSDVPDISESLRLLRQYQSLSGTGP